MTQKKAFTSSVHHGHSPGHSPHLGGIAAGLRGVGSLWEAEGGRRGDLHTVQVAGVADSRGGTARRSVLAVQRAEDSPPSGAGEASGIRLCRRNSRGEGYVLCIRRAARRGAGHILGEEVHGGHTRQRVAHYKGDGRGNGNARAVGWWALRLESIQVLA